MSKSSKRNILIVEDEKSIRDLLVDIVKSLEHKPVVAGDSEAALIKLDKTRIHLSLIDLGLPTDDGLSLARKIRKIDSRIPIILMSGVNLKKTRIKDKLAGVNEFVYKPFKVDLMVEKIKNALEKAESEAVDIN